MELYVKYKFHKKHSVMIAGGYDFNFIDQGTKCDPDELISGYGEGDNTELWKTYFYGQGPSARLGYDFIYDSGERLEKFFSISVIAKSRVYNDYLFLPLHAGAGVCESGKQSILGASIYFGVDRKYKKYAFRFYGGAGFRYLWNDVHWEKQALYPYDPSEENFTRHHALPSFDFGIIFYFKALG